MSKKRIFILIIVLIAIATVVILLNMRLQNKSSTDGIIEIAEIKAGALSQREGKKIEIFDDNNRKIIAITQTINSKANGIYDVTMNFHAEKCIKEIKNMTTTETLFEASADLENLKDVEINRQGEKDTVNTYKITMANGYAVEHEIKISDFFPENNTAPSKPNIEISPKQNISVQTPVTITAESADAENDEIEYIWEGRTEETSWYAYGNHTVKVKAVDLYGAESEWEEKQFTVAKYPMPYLTFDNEPEEIDTDGDGIKEKWYPYGTIVTINYTINDEGTIDSYYSITDSIGNGNWNANYGSLTNYSEKLYETSTIKAYTKDENGESSPILEEKINIMIADNNIPDSYKTLGNIYPVKVRGDKNRYSYGTDIYSIDETNMNTSAVHMGLVADGEEKILKIKIVGKPEGGYIARYRNGINSQDSNEGNYGFVFVNENNDEIKAPTIENMEIVQDGDKIITNVSAIAYNGATIEKYYYKLNTGGIQESISSTYLLENAIQNVNNVVRVYVKDSNGAVSDECVRITGNPYITLDKQAEIVDGVKWYPNETRVTGLNYAVNSEYLTFWLNTKIGDKEDIDYQYDDEDRAGVIASNGRSNSVDYNRIIQRITTTIKIWVTDMNGNKISETEEEIHIMPSDAQMNYDYYNFNREGKEFPVKVTGYNNWCAGTDIYQINSPIRTSAIHMGLVRVNETKILKIRIVKKPEGGIYVGSYRNGIESEDYIENDYDVGYIFIDNNGNQIIGSE